MRPLALHFRVGRIDGFARSSVRGFTHHGDAATTVLAHPRVGLELRTTVALLHGLADRHLFFSYMVKRQIQGEEGEMAWATQNLTAYAQGGQTEEVAVIAKIQVAMHHCQYYFPTNSGVFQDRHMVWIFLPEPHGRPSRSGGACSRCPPHHARASRGRRPQACGSPSRSTVQAPWGGSQPKPWQRGGP